MFAVPKRFKLKISKYLEYKFSTILFATLASLNICSEVNSFTATVAADNDGVFGLTRRDCAKPPVDKDKKSRDKNNFRIVFIDRIKQDFFKISPINFKVCLPCQNDLN